MMCDSCKRKYKEDEEDFYECDTCDYYICEKCMKKQGKRCKKCGEGRLSQS